MAFFLPRVSVHGVDHSAVDRQFIYSSSLIFDFHRRSEPAIVNFLIKGVRRSHSDLLAHLPVSRYKSTSWRAQAEHTASSLCTQPPDRAGLWPST